MSIIGNIFWFLLGGLVTSLLYFIAGLLMCCTIIGIPFGLQLFKLGALAMFPFGKEVSFVPSSGCLTIGLDVLWIVFGWWEIAIVHFVFAILCAITIIGIPFAKQHFKLIKMSLLPFGMKILR